MTRIDYCNFVNGQFVESRRRFEDINPATGSVHAIVHEADEALVDEAVAAGRSALDGDWG